MTYTDVSIHLIMILLVNLPQGNCVQNLRTLTSKTKELQGGSGPPGTTPFNETRKVTKEK